jgi:hypothetical protein
MDSRRRSRSHLPTPPHLTRSGKAAFSLEKVLAFLKWNSSAGDAAGVFFGYRRSIPAQV